MILTWYQELWFSWFFFFFFTETETVLAGDTPRHSSNTEGAVHSQEPSNVILQNIHYFSKHDTIKLGEHNFLLWKHQILLILEGYDLEGFVLGTVSVPPSVMELKVSVLIILSFLFIKSKTSSQLLGCFQQLQMKSWSISRQPRLVLVFGKLLKGDLGPNPMLSCQACVIYSTLSRKRVLLSKIFG